MPLVTIKGIEGVFTDQQKAEVIQKVTDTIVSVEGENMRALTWVIFEEVKNGDWGIAGKPMTAQEILKLQADQ
ncbi:tautomerase family protein [Pseudomonas frederiksbergensis]|uniref:2-hydroxymuconate tautomerase n=1 Tax=Pseudomonas frederiksbergensis TaxID=104087 RepID=A0A423HKG4_9PSED|nr:4-oxalocrotonate tautomerase family protein [Pseudomonas frederiksbergensis]RON13669.1 4-oxalocrotonate tautomerase [Pseudomonas frederiksbergensis]RON13716.1 4-oxalocrotonate tautomerase [Pseudomonas frederiksbergensis]